MFEINGKYNTAKVFTSIIEKEAISQIIELCNQAAFKDSKIRIMPDVHSGKGCTIGTTMTIKDKVIPNLVGVDIGCGMLTINLGKNKPDFDKLDKVINEHVPSGCEVRKILYMDRYLIDDMCHITELKCYNHIDAERAYFSLGSLGGGNHFIEVNKDSFGDYYLVIHSGSRHLGVDVAKYYQNEAYKNLYNKTNGSVRNELISRLKSEGREKEISVELAKLKSLSVSKDYSYCEGDLFRDYIHDMKIVQFYADINRQIIANEIINNMKNLDVKEFFSTVHNYIDTENMILRKGSISAQKGERVIIPINMRDGSIIAVGKGNEDWNYSAPHGAGRLMSRSKAKEIITLDEFQKSMTGIYSTSVNLSTIDESPMSYKPIDEILHNIKDTVEVEKIIKPIFNFKASS